MKYGAKLPGFFQTRTGDRELQELPAVRATPYRFEQRDNVVLTIVIRCDDFRWIPAKTSTTDVLPDSLSEAEFVECLPGFRRQDEMSAHVRPSPGSLQSDHVWRSLQERVSWRHREAQGSMLVTCPRGDVRRYRYAGRGNPQLLFGRQLDFSCCLVAAARHEPCTE
jgi:hypothetical protein